MFSDQLLEENQFKRYLANHLTDNHKFPSERYLSDRFQIPRSQVRKILKNLVDEGTLYVKKNSGYYVSPQRIKINLSEGESYFDTTSSKLQRTVFVACNLIKLPANIQKVLEAKTPKGAEIIGVQVKESRPYGIIFSYLPDKLIKKIEITEFQSVNLYHLLAKKGIAIAHLKEQVSQANSTEFSEKILNLPPKSRLVRHEVFSYDAQGRCLLDQLLFYPLNRVSFEGWQLS